MNYRETARLVVEYIGGGRNVLHLEHCSTRLRFTLRDPGLVNLAALEQVPGVMGVRQNVQCQVIIGNDVIEVYEQARLLLGDESAAEPGPVTPKLSWGSVILDFVIGIFQPLIPVIAGGGVLKSVLLLLDMCGWLDSKTSTFQILNHIGSAPLYFLPLLVAITTANKLKVNPLVAVSAVGALLLPAMSALLASGTHLFVWSVPNVAYASQVFPAILSVLLYARTERLFTRYSPKSVRVFLVPMLSLLVTVPVTLLVLGPLGYTFGQGFSSVILFLFSKFGFIATALLAGFLPFMVATGMHKAMIPYAVSSMSQFGRELLYLPASLAHNIAESGASFAVACRTHDRGLRSTALSAGVSALFGITEPALYGITLLHKRVLYCVMIGSVVGGAFIGLMSVAAFALVGPGLASLSMFIAPDNTMNIAYALMTLTLSFIVSFVSVFLVWREPAVAADSVRSSTARHSSACAFNSPVEGQVIPLDEVHDDLFARKIIGDGFAVIPESGVLYAPADGVVVTVFKTGHAVSMRTENGAELIFHIGIDTVRLDGQYFSPQVNPGQAVKAGEVLVRFDLGAIIAAGYDPVVMTVVTNLEHYSVNQLIQHKQVSNHEVIMTLSAQS